jgi:hypothetical protein
MSYPRMGATQLLVYRECPHGCWCATGEGARAPLCAEHLAAMVPGGGPKGMFGAADGSDLHDVHVRRRLGFAAVFGYEQALVKAVLDYRKQVGLLVPMGDGTWSIGGHFEERRDRYFSEAEQKREDAP